MSLTDRAQLLALASIVALNTSGCTVNTGYPEGRDLSRAPGTAPRPVGAMLVGSVTNPDPHVGTHADIRFFFRQVSGEDYFYVRNAPNAGWLSGPDRKADRGFESSAGKMFSVSVTPGEYEIVWVNIWLQFSRDAKFDPRPRFKVGLGEILYIGNLEVTNCYSLYIAPNGERRRQTVVGGFIEIRDESTRDVPALRDTFPSLREAPIVERVIDNEALVAGGAEQLSRRCAYERRENN